MHPSQALPHIYSGVRYLLQSKNLFNVYLKVNWNLYASEISQSQLLLKRFVWLYRGPSVPWVNRDKREHKLPVLCQVLVEPQFHAKVKTRIALHYQICITAPLHQSWRAQVGPFQMTLWLHYHRQTTACLVPDETGSMSACTQLDHSDLDQITPSTQPCVLPIRCLSS